MKCFNHNEWDAVGVCKNCGRGLCNECAVEIEGSLACKNRCEESVKILTSMVKRSAKLTGVSGRFYIATGTISVIIGLLVLTLINIISFKCFSGIFLILGLIFLVLGALAILTGKALVKDTSRLNDKHNS